MGKKSFDSIDDTGRVRDLRSLKNYIEKFGCSKQIQKEFSLNEKQIMLVTEVGDIEETCHTSLSIDGNIAKVFENNPDATLEDVENHFKDMKDLMLRNLCPEIAEEYERTHPRPIPRWYNCNDEYDDEDWYEDDDYDYRPESYYGAMRKNELLVIQLDRARDKFCGLGTRRVKLFLNKKMKEGDKNAELYRLALETEDKNITAKQTYRKYREKVYNQKTCLLDALIDCCYDRDDIVYGYQDSDNYSANTVVYFELPEMEQISFHTNMTRSEKDTIPEYEKEWDGKVNSTLDKIEATLNAVYKDELDKERERYKKADEKKRLKREQELREQRKANKKAKR